MLIDGGIPLGSIITPDSDFVLFPSEGGSLRIDADGKVHFEQAGNAMIDIVYSLDSFCTVPAGSYYDPAIPALVLSSGTIVYPSQMDYYVSGRDGAIGTEDDIRISGPGVMQAVDGNKTSMAHRC